MASDVFYEFRTTCVPGIVDEAALAEMGTYIKGAKKWCLQQFRPDITLDDKFMTVKPYDKETLERLRKIASEFAETAEIRGI